ncbi:MAG: hypothetical protein KGD64_14040 [Candidatus Heimdallarchaeota archaeon]|nr:hypothetical protein [Candidatus Heimdallarchaeota archaeon]
MKNKKQTILGIILCVVFSLAAIQHTQAAVKIFEETYVTDDRKFTTKNGQEINMWTDSKTEWNEKIYSTKKLVGILHLADEDKTE